MPLHWNLTKIADHEKVCYDDRDGKKYMNPVTETLIYHTMTVGINQITEKNVEEFFLREEAVATVLGAPLVKSSDLCSSDGTVLEEGRGPFENVKITLAEIRQHIGLHTNASNMTLAAFKKHMGEVLWRNVLDQLRYQKNKERAEAHTV